MHTNHQYVLVQLHYQCPYDHSDVYVCIIENL